MIWSCFLTRNNSHFMDYWIVYIFNDSFINFYLKKWWLLIIQLLYIMFQYSIVATQLYCQQWSSSVPRDFLSFPLPLVLLNAIGLHSWACLEGEFWGLPQGHWSVRQHQICQDSSVASTWSEYRDLKTWEGIDICTLSFSPGFILPNGRGEWSGCLKFCLF